MMGSSPHCLPLFFIKLLWLLSCLGNTHHADVYDYSSDDVIDAVCQPELLSTIILGPNHTWKQNLETYHSKREC